MSCSVPEAGEGISASTLSVEISNSGSSRWTFSPGCFSHLVMVPSKIDSPIWGMMTSVGIISFRENCQQLALPENLSLYRGGNEDNVQVGFTAIDDDSNDATVEVR